MKQFGLRYLYKHLGKALKEIPFEITNHNRVIAVVSPTDNQFYSKSEAEIAFEKELKINPTLKNEPQKLN